MSHPHDPHTHAHGHVVDIPGAGAADSAAHHQHVVVSKRMLVAVLGLLMFCTLLTVGAAQSEQWFAHRFNVEIPQWVNVAVALSIAAFKSIIVAGFFMQLRYDNPMNSAIAVFTIMVLAFFLGFTMIDLGSRDALYSWKAHQIIVGGSGGIDTAGNGVIPANTSIAQYARLRADEKIAELEAAGKPLPNFLEHYKETKAGRGSPGHGGHAAATSTADTSRTKSGITLPELGAAPAHGEHAPPAAGEHNPAAPAPPAKPSH